MKILVVAPTPFFSDRGTHIRILEEALALERRGHEVTIATYHIGADLPPSLLGTIDVRRIRRLLFWYKKLEAGPDWQKIVLDLLLIKKTFFLARTKRPDIIHGHLHEGALIGWLVQKFLFWRKMRLVVDFHGSLTKEMVSHQYLGASGLKKLFEEVEHFIDNLGDKAITSSWTNTAEIGRIRSDDRPETVLDGVNMGYYENFPSIPGLRKKYRVPENALVVTYTGALVPNKGILHFIEAIPLILAGHPDAHIVIAGFPWNEVAPYFADKAWIEKVTVITPLPYFSNPEILHMSDVGVDPKEALVGQASGKMLTYMGAGLPIVCFDTENNREYVGEGGEYAREVSAEGLAEATLKLLRDPELRKRKGEANQERAREHFSWEKTGRQLERIYESLVPH